LPGRPNGASGWIEQKGTRARVTDVRLVVDTTLRRVTVYRRGAVVRTLRAVVGRSASPTPHGEFFVEEAVALPSTAAGAPYAFALSARSEVYQEFDGGAGQVAIHGRGQIGGILGTATSHGCVRLDDGALGWLVMIVGPGVPVTVHG
jgi:lipoprotein-anchoring transpeptidase ErfK/SrfK